MNDSSRYMSIDELHDVAAKSLCAFDSFCEKNNLRYWLLDGTLLGAVRHKGFIPWDDDVDVGMPSSDYLKMMQILRVQPQSLYPYAVISYELDRDYYRPWARLYDTRAELVEGQGLALGQRCDKDVHPFVDIFPIVGFSGNVAKRKIQTTILKMKFRSLALLVGPSEIKGRSVPRMVKQAVRPLLRGVGQERIMCSLAKEYSRPSRRPENSPLVAPIYDVISCYWPRDYFEEFVRLEFEGACYLAPKRYHEVLTAAYGDYMALPPEEERSQVFETKVKWRDGSVL